MHIKWEKKFILAQCSKHILSYVHHGSKWCGLHNKDKAGNEKSEIKVESEKTAIKGRNRKNRTGKSVMEQRSQ